MHIVWRLRQQQPLISWLNERNRLSVHVFTVVGCHFKSIWAKNGITICQHRLHISTPKWNEIKQKPPHSKQYWSGDSIWNIKTKSVVFAKNTTVCILHGEQTERNATKLKAISMQNSVRICSFSLFSVFFFFFFSYIHRMWCDDMNLICSWAKLISTICVPLKSFVLP